MLQAALSKSAPVDAPTAHGIFDGGGELGARTWGAVKHVLDQGHRFHTITCTSAGLINACCYAAAVYEGGDIAESFDRHSRAVWKKVCDRAAGVAALRIFTHGLPSLEQMAAHNVWQIQTAGEHVCAWWGIKTPSLNVLGKILRESLPDIDAALKNPQGPAIICNRLHLYTGQEQVLNSRDTHVTLDDMIATTALPPFFPAVDGVWVDGALGGRNGLLQEVPRNDLPVIRINLGKPDFKAYGDIYRFNPLLRRHAELADKMPEEAVPHEMDIYNIGFKRTPETAIELPTWDRVLAHRALGEQTAKLANLPLAMVMARPARKPAFLTSLQSAFGR